MTLIRPTTRARLSHLAPLTAPGRSFGASHIGLRRERNEDAFVAHDALGLYAVADGVGGCAAGHVASVTAISAALHFMASRRELLAPLAAGSGSAGLLERLAATALQTAALEVTSASGALPGLRGMCTTLTLLLRAGRRVALAHAGDSRGYLVRRDGDVEQLTDDHTLAADLLRRGLLRPEDATSSGCLAGLTRCLGGPASDVVTPQIVSGELSPGEAIVLCTDGLTGYVDDDEIADAVITLSPARAAQSLIALANQRGGGDNITVVIVEG